MDPIVTPAIVLALVDYQESSRIVRLLTRASGVRSALARNAKASRKRFGGAMDLFAEGTATLERKAGRDLDTLGAFELTRAHLALAADLDRFVAASALAEFVVRAVGDHGDGAEPGSRGRREGPEALSEPADHTDGASSAVFDDVSGTLAVLADRRGEAVHAAVLGAHWRIVAALGFAPVLTTCVECGDPVPPDADVVFDHRDGGVRCARCSPAGTGGRRLPAEARRQLAAWLDGSLMGPEATPDRATLRAHQRLLREFLAEHLLDPRPLRAWGQWAGSLADG